MPNQKLINYIKQAEEAGQDDEKIKSDLMAIGWEERDINEAFDAVLDVPVPPPSPVSPAPSPFPSVPSFTPTASVLLSGGALLGNAWKIFKQRFWTFLGIIVIPILVAIPLFIIVAVSGGLSFLTGFSMITSGIFLVFAGLYSLILFVIQSWSNIALLFAIKDKQENIGVIKSYRRGWHKLISYWWISILIFIIVLSPLYFSLIIFSLGEMVASYFEIEITIIGTLFSGLLFIFGILWFIITFLWFSLTSFVLVFEDLTGMNALLKSREYVRGKWWAVAWRILFISLLFIIIGLVNFIPILGSIIFWIITPLATVYLFLMYDNLKAVKGEFTFAPEFKQKIPFLLVGLLSVLLLIALLIFLNIRKGETIAPSWPIISPLEEARSKARDARRQDDLYSIAINAEMYYDDFKHYPTAADYEAVSFGKYLLTKDEDPLNEGEYVYVWRNNTKNDQKFIVCTTLENAVGGKKIFYISEFGSGSGMADECPNLSNVTLLIYENKDLGFKLSLPYETWFGYKTKIIIDKENSTRIGFYLPVSLVDQKLGYGKDMLGYESVFVIIIYKKDIFQNNQDIKLRFTNNILLSTGKYIYVYESDSQDPPNFAFDPVRKFETVIKETEKVIKSFEWINAGVEKM